MFDIFTEWQECLRYNHLMTDIFIEAKDMERDVYVLGFEPKPGYFGETAALMRRMGERYYKAYGLDYQINITDVIFRHRSQGTHHVQPLLSGASRSGFWGGGYTGLWPTVWGLTRPEMAL